MLVKDAMTTKVEWIDPETSLMQAAKKLRDAGVGFLPIRENDSLIGIVTDRDITCRGVAGDLDPANTPAKDIRGWSRDGAPDLGAFEIPPTTGVPAPSIYLLSQNAPNPFNGISRFDFILPADADVSLDLFDLRGRRVRTMIDERLGAGRHDVTLDARGLAAGTYFYRLKVGERVETRRCVVVR